MAKRRYPHVFSVAATPEMAKMIEASGLCAAEWFRRAGDAWIAAEKNQRSPLERTEKQIADLNARVDVVLRQLESARKHTLILEGSLRTMEASMSDGFAALAPELLKALVKLDGLRQNERQDHAVIPKTTRTRL